jgi:hypothetical protein
MSGKRGAVTLLAVVVLPVVVSGNATRTISLDYDATLSRGDFPNPAARLTVNGRTAWFLFDTGAGIHTVASWFADAAGLEVDHSFGEKVGGVDATGRPYAMGGVYNSAGRLDDGSDLTLEVAAVAEFPSDFEQFEIGGVVNPQLLAAEGQAAVLDLRVPELRLEPFDQAVERTGARAVPRDQLQVCGSPKDAIPNLLFALDVSAGGRTGRLLVDSGAGITKLVRDSALVGDVPLAPGGHASGLAGKPQPFRLARGLEMRFGDFRVTVDARVVDEGHGQCGPDGILGLDALRQCVMVFSDKDLAIACGR